MIMTINTKSLLMVLVIVVTTNLPLLAAEDLTDPLYEEEYVVTATRIPQTPEQVPGMTETIRGEEVEQGIRTVATVLAENGLSLNTNGGDFSFARPQMDGVNDSRLQFLVNGVPLSPDPGGNVDLSNFPTAGLEKIEVVHGPLSALYGANALGGVINIITDLTGEANNKLTLNRGSYGSRRWGVGFAQERWGIALGENITEGHRPHSKAEGSYVSGQYNILQKDQEYLTLRANFMDKDALLPGHLTDGGRGRQKDQLVLADLSGKAQWSGGLWEYKIYAQNQERTYEGFDWETKDTHEVTNYGLDVAALYEVANHQLIAGSTFKVDAVDSTASGQRTLENYALYLQDLWYLSGDLMFLSGLRWDYNAQYGAPLSPRLSITKSFSDDLHLTLAYGEAFRAPTINDLYWEDPYYHGNPDLKPERSQRYDLIANWITEKSSFTVDLYRSLIKDGIEMTADWSTVKNIGRIKITGLNLKLEREIATNFSGLLRYDWLNKIELDKNTGKYNPNTPYGAHHINLAVSYNWNKLISTLNWQMVSGRKKLPGFPVSDDYQLVQLDFEYQLNELLNLSLTAHNLLDEEYEIENGYPMPGRSFSAGLNCNF
jgi:outer membrane cobalamin receptor